MNPTEQSGRALAARIKELCDRKISKAAERGDFQCFVRRDEIIDSDSTMEPILMAIVSAYARDQPNLKTAWTNRFEDGEQHMCLRISWMPPQDQAVALATQWLAAATEPAPPVRSATNAIRQAGMEQADRMAKTNLTAGLSQSDAENVGIVYERLQQEHAAQQERHRRNVEQADRMAKGLVHTPELARMETARMRAVEEHRAAEEARRASYDPYLFIDDQDEHVRQSMLRSRSADADARAKRERDRYNDNDL